MVRRILRHASAAALLAAMLHPPVLSAAGFQLASGWSNYGGSYAEAQAARQGALCVVSGLVRSTSKRVPTRPAVIGKLSSDCRPAERLIFNLNDHERTARVDVYPDGQVIWHSGFGRNWVSLSGITFAVGKPAALRLNRGWTNYGSAWQGAHFAREGELCLVSGLIKPTGKLSRPADVAVLPPECRPSAGLIFKLHANSHSPNTRVDVYPDGRVRLREQGGFNNWLSLSGIVFRSKRPANDLPLVNGWQHYGNVWQRGGFFTTGQLCSLSGLIRGRNYGHVANVPVACRPDKRLIFNVHANTHDQTTRLDVFPDGRVHWVAGGKGGWISLAGINYMAAKTAPPVVTPAVTALPVGQSAPVHQLAAPSLPLASDHPPPQVGALTTGLFGGDGGQTPYQLACGPGEVLIGVEGNAGSWIDRIGIVCMRITDDGRWAQPRVDVGFSAFSTGGTPKDDDSWFFTTTLCDRDFAVQGIRGIEGWYVDRLQLECRRLTDGTFTTGARRSTVSVGSQGGGGSSEFGPARCPDNRAATGLFGNSGIYVDSVGLKCLDESHWRPSFHFSPQTGWMNDPAGLVYTNNQYHLYYQAIPRSNIFNAARMEWGHAVSTDLVNWNQQASVFRPELMGLIRISPYTGSGIVTPPQGGLQNGACDCAASVTGRCVIALFTRHVNPVGPQYQTLATSCNGGMSYTSDHQAVLASGTDQPHFRDPKVFLYEDPDDASNRYWVMTVVAGDLIKFYRSGLANENPLDLTRWTELSAIRIFAHDADTGKGPFTETPDLIELPVINGSGTQWVLLFAEGYLPFGLDIGPADNVGAREYSKAWYLIGDFDGTRFRAAVSASAPANKIELARRMDGPDFYAPQTWFIEPAPAVRRTSNLTSPRLQVEQVLALGRNRYIMGGWLSNWLYAHALPTGRWRGQLAIPRELSLRQQSDGNVVLVQAPVRELESRRRPRLLDWSLEDITIDQRKRTVPSFAALAYEAEVVVDMTPGAQTLRLEIRHGTGPGRAAVGWRRIGNDGFNGEIFLDRTAAYSGGGETPIGFPLDRDRNTLFAAPLALESGRLRLRVLVDRSSIEVFGGDGEAALSGLFFPHPGNRQFTIQAMGGAARIVSMDLYPME